MCLLLQYAVFKEKSHTCIPEQIFVRACSAAKNHVSDLT